MQDLCRDFNIPTGSYEVFREPGAAKEHIRAVGPPIVVKADGLAAGKGVVVARTVEEALAAVDDMLVSHKFGDAGAPPFSGNNSTQGPLRLRCHRCVGICLRAVNCTMCLKAVDGIRCPVLVGWSVGLELILTGVMWNSGAEIVVEEFLDGEEASFFALIDGETCVALASAQV